jgi:signal transduction histidine kinase
MTADKERLSLTNRQPGTVSEGGPPVDEESALEMFASTFAHDIRTPLLVVRRHLEARDAAPERIERVEKALEDVKQVSKEMYTQAGKADADSPLVKTTLATAATEAWQQVPTQVARLRIDDNRPIVAHPVALEEILVNAFRNAIEHGVPNDVDSSEPWQLQYSSSPSQLVATALSRCQGTDDCITVTVGATADGFYVEDDGPGIPEDVEESLFEPETGLGLALVEWFATTQGWSVSATTGSDGGARLEFTGLDGAERGT